MMALALSGTVRGLTGTALITLGITLLLTGTAGRCWIYRLLGWNTLPRTTSEPLTSP